MDLVDVLAKMDEHLARQDAILAKMDERTAALASLMTENERRAADRAAQHERTMARLAEIMAGCHHEAAAAHQAASTAMARYAEVGLSVDAFLTVARELLTEWRRQRPQP